MAASLTISPVNSLIFIHGSGYWITPTPIREQLVWSTRTCIASACYPEIDGPTKIVLGLGKEVAINAPAVFDGMLETSKRDVLITTVDDDRPALMLPVTTDLTRVRIWYSHPKWPEIVTIGLN